jgi:hypothetical protein
MDGKWNPRKARGKEQREIAHGMDRPQDFLYVVHVHHEKK